MTQFIHVAQEGKPRAKTVRRPSLLSFRGGAINQVQHSPSDQTTAPYETQK